jgi:hypothetical protein
MFEKDKTKILRELYKVGRNSNDLTYNQVAERIGYTTDTFYLHHFLLKLQREGMIHYKEINHFDDVLKFSLK